MSLLNRSPVLFLLFLTMACGKGVSVTPSPEKAPATFQALLEEAIEDSFDQVKGVSMTVIAPESDIYWTGAAGFDSNEKTDSLQADQPFRIASVTKMFVATAILRLHERGLLSIDDPISDYLSEGHLQLLRNGGYDPQQISIKHCLNHTSGLFDYAMGNSAYADIVRSNPQKRWTRTEQIQLAMEIGTATGKPGERYSYGDTGYILAGEIIEHLTDSTLGWGLRDLLHFDSLGMKATWLETIEGKPPGMPPVVHRYFQRLDATEYDASIDLYGGGGLVSTTNDLATFMHALFNGGIFQDPKTLELMIAPTLYADSYVPEENPRHKDYRLGLWEVDIYGERAYLHRGLWGTILMHLPAYNCTLAINYTNGQRDRLLKKALLVVQHLHQQRKDT